MDQQTIDAIISLNQKFYEDFGPAFAATRRRVQDGVRRVLERLPDEGRWLDLGCGSGALAVEWLKRGRRSAYLGLDFSQALLNEAAAAAAETGDAIGSPVSFRQANLGDPTWADGLSGPFRGALSFAVFHHLPSRELRLGVLQRLRELLSPGGLFVHSEWQFQHSEKLMARRLPWSTAGLDESLLEPGDTLLDWRFALPGQPEQTGLRYVHLFTRAELAALAEDSGFRVIEEFESDGQGGRLSLYQVWEK